MTHQAKALKTRPAADGATRRALGRHMRQARKDAGLTQVELAALMSVGQTAVSAWENGDAYPTMDRFIEFARITSVNVEALMADLLADVA